MSIPRDIELMGFGELGAAGFAIANSVIPAELSDAFESYFSIHFAVYYL